VDTAAGAETPAAEGERDGRRRRRRGGRAREEGSNEDGTPRLGDGSPAEPGEIPATGTPAADLAPGAPAEATPAAAETNEGGERERGRRRRGGRSREGREGGEAVAVPFEGETAPAAGLTVATFDEGTATTATTATTAAAALVEVAPVASSMPLQDAAPTEVPVATIAATAPAAQAPAAASPVAEVPVAEVPVAEAPVAEVPVAEAPAAKAPDAAPVVAAPAVAAAAARITPYNLPTDALLSLAQGAGLEWVNSDVEKIRAVQSAMAAEPKANHVPREPKRHVLADDGPLVLVETRKDLSQMKLPFEQNAAAAAAPQ